MRTVVRGTPYSSVKVGNTEGQRAGSPSGADGQTSMSQYRGTGMSTTQARGTPYHSQGGNGPESKRVVSSDKYGKVTSNQQGDANNPASNGTGVSLDDARAARTLDSPVPSGAPEFDPGFIHKEDLAHLGSGNAGGAETLVNSSGVMGRGMVGTSTPGGSEFELTDDDALPGVAPA